MAIVVLPPSAIRAIGSTQTITDPASLVKELVDNALDAGAKAIFVEIAVNTIDKIIVRDDGQGIAPEDRGMACKRYCTSKIKSLEDLHDLGGQSLGFRGEALASAAGMSSNISITTKIEGELLAKEIQYSVDGLAKSEKRVSHAVGTTVTIDHFLSNLPVRKQTAEKSSAKSLSKIKKLLQAYALARPCVRLFFKVLKARNDKGDWSYAPKIEANSHTNVTSPTLDAAFKVFGRKAAKQLHFHSTMWSSTGEYIDPDLPDIAAAGADVSSTYRFESLVADPSCMDIVSISGLGQHISVDNRPVSCGRGVLKEISSHYKLSLRSAIADSEDRKVKDPLLVLNIKCPKGSYDVNVEPAKDDLLFNNSILVLQVAQKTFNRIYGEKQAQFQTPLASKSTSGTTDFDVLLAKKTPNQAHSTRNGICQSDGNESVENRVNNRGSGLEDKSVNDPGHVDLHGSGAPLNNDDETDFLIGKRSKRRTSMCADGDEDLELFTNCSTSCTPRMVEEGSVRDANISNPWTFAKMNAPVRLPMRREECGKESGHLPTPRRQRGDIADGLELSSEDGPGSPGTSPTLFPYPLKAFGKRQVDEPGNTQPALNLERRGHGALDTWIQSITTNNSLDPKVYQSNDEAPGDRYESSSGFISARIAHLKGTALRDIPDVSQRARPKQTAREQQEMAINNHSISPIHDPERVRFDTGGKIGVRRSQNPRLSHSKSINQGEIEDESTSPSPTSAQTIHPDLAMTLDYEARKARATLEHREKLRREKAAEAAGLHAAAVKQRTLDSLFRPQAAQQTPNSPHKNRQNKAIAALHADAAAQAAYSADPRPPLVGSSTKRTRSVILPLETVKEQDWVSDLILPIITDESAIASGMRIAVDCDDYAYQGESTGAFDELEERQIQGLKRRLQSLMGKLYRKGDPHVEDGTSVAEEDLVFDLHEILLRKRTGNA